MVNYGTNDLAALPSQAAFETSLADILDTLNAKWPQGYVFVAKPWRRGYTANANTLAGWIDNVLATRGAFAFAGPDERTWLENGDDGVTYTSDGIHYNATGNYVNAQQWMAVSGL